MNAYLREISGEDITAKDFRTWAGTVLAFRALCALDPAASDDRSEAQRRRGDQGRRRAPREHARGLPQELRPSGRRRRLSRGRPRCRPGGRRGAIRRSRADAGSGRGGRRARAAAGDACSRPRARRPSRSQAGPAPRAGAAPGARRHDEHAHRIRRPVTRPSPAWPHAATEPAPVRTREFARSESPAQERLPRWRSLPRSLRSSAASSAGS